MQETTHIGQGDPSPFAFEGSGAGPACLLIHGLTGSPAEMRPLGEYLQTKGASVRAPLLPGHGLEPEALSRVTWQDWVNTAEEALHGLFASERPTFVIGLSMGALVAAELAARHPELAGMVLYSPAYKVANKLAPLAPWLRHLIPSVPKTDKTDLSDPEAEKLLWHYPCWPTGGVAELWLLTRVVRERLPQITVPSMIFVSTQDASIARDSGPALDKRLGSPDKELVHLHHSGHVLTVDIERETVFAKTWGFICAHLSHAAQPPRPRHSSKEQTTDER